LPFVVVVVVDDDDDDGDEGYYNIWLEKIK